MATYQGSCHCGKIAYEVEGNIAEVVDCNCSLCSRRGYLLAFLPGSALHLRTPEENLATYTFNTHRIKHHFCPTCGCAPFGLGKNHKGEPMVAVNLRCLQNLDIAALPVKHFDGKKL